MTVRVLVVDDSAFMRQRITSILEQDRQISVVDVADNGLDAVRKSSALKPDVITMDVTMPVMDGIAAVKQIMRRRPTPILMLSSLTKAGAESTLAALEAGAADFMPKQLDELAADDIDGGQGLRQRVIALAKRSRQAPKHWPNTGTGNASASPARLARGGYQLLVVAASTGGPLALQTIVPKLPAKIGFPVLLIQHMPASFTTSFAKRLNQLSQIQVREAQDGDILQPGVALVAPGGRQLELANSGRIMIRDGAPGEIYKPSADVAFASISENFQGRVLALVMTGMGADGRIGAEKLKTAHARIWVQDEASCVVYGMPKAVAEAGLADQVLPLDQIGVAFEGL